MSCRYEQNTCDTAAGLNSHRNGRHLRRRQAPQVLNPCSAAQAACTTLALINAPPLPVLESGAARVLRERGAAGKFNQLADAVSCPLAHFRRCATRPSVVSAPDDGCLNP